MIDMTDVLMSAYALGGREPGRVIDCLGVTRVGAMRFCGCGPDPWMDIQQAWRAGTLDVTTGFPPCWIRRTDGQAIENGDVLLFYGRHPWSAIVLDGHVYSADQEVGPYCRPLSRWTKTPAEIWRHDQAAHSQGTDR